MKRQIRRIVGLLMSVIIIITGYPTRIVKATPVHTSEEEMQPITYIAVDNTCLDVSETQKIVVGLDMEGLLNVQLEIQNTTSGEKEKVQATSYTEQACSFEISYLTNDRIGVYQVVALVCNTNGVEASYLLSDYGFNIQYGVGKEVNTYPDVILEDEEEFETQLELESNIITFNENGEADNEETISECLSRSEDELEITAAITAKADGNTIVVLDPGHDATHGGTSIGGDGYNEATLNLKIAQYCKEELGTYKNITVYMTRNENTCPYPGTSTKDCNSSRVSYAKSVGADYYISFHLNSHGDPSVNGVEIYYPNGNYNSSISEDGKGLAEEIIDELVELGLTKRGVKTTYSSDYKYPDGSTADMYQIIRESKLAGFPAIIIEHAFLSNANDKNNYLSTDAQLKSLGLADATGIARYLGLEKRSKLEINTSVYTCYPNTSSCFAVYYEGVKIPNTRVTWSSSNPEVATVNSGGGIYAVKPGKTVITCYDAETNTTATCDVTVLDWRKVTLSASVYTMNGGDYSRFAAYVDGKLVDAATMTWSSSDESIATISNDGRLVGVKGGKATISCTMPGGTVATCEVTVVDQLRINTSKYACRPDTSSRFAVYFNGQLIPNEDVIWSSSNPEIAKVSASGGIAGINEGTAIVTAYYKELGIKATCEVTVLKRAKVTLSAPVYTMNGGDYSRFAAYVDGKLVDAATMTWSSSDESIATISNDGRLVGVKGGKATISCTMPGGTVATCEVTVVDQLRINTSKYACRPDTSSRFAVYFNGQLIPNEDVIWSSSNPEIAKVSASGGIAGINEGTAIVTAYYKELGIKATCEVTVLKRAKVTLSASVYTMNGGDYSRFAAYVDGKLVDAATMTWSSSDESIATISNDGRLVGVKGGKATISCTMPGGTVATCEVTVADRLKINTTSYACYPTQSSCFAVYLNGQLISNQSVIWKSSDTNIAIVTEKGEIRGVRPGKVTITAYHTTTGTTSICQVTVKDYKKVTLNTYVYSCSAGQSSRFAAYVDGVLVDNSTMTWTSDDESIVKVTENGGITAYSKGTTLVRCTTQYGTTATCQVTVLGYDIMGSGNTTLEKMVKYYNKNATYPTYYKDYDAPTIEAFCQMYIEECGLEGVNVEVAFCQAMKETGFLRFGGDVDISQFNFAGIGAVGGGAEGASFPSMQIGIRAQIQHLKAYASTEPLNQDCVDPRFNLVQRGKAPVVEMLGVQENPYGVGWATGKNYGYSILSDYIYKLMGE